MNAEVPSSLDENDTDTPDAPDAETPSEATDTQETGEDSSAPQNEAAPAEGEDAAGGETQQRRRELRESEITGSVTVNGSSFSLTDWSSSGFGVSDCKEEFEENARVDIDFSITLDSGPLAFSCKAIIVRSDVESGNMAGAFVEMRREDRVLVTKYFDAMEG